MNRFTRRAALGSTMTMCHLPTMAQLPSAAGQEAQTRQAIEAYAKAWQRDDIPALLACYHADFTLNYFGRNALAGRHEGKSTSLMVLGQMRQRTQRKLKAIESVMVGGDQATMLTRESLTSQGQSVEVTRLYLYTVAGGQLRECWVYDQNQRLVDDLIGA